MAYVVGWCLIVFCLVLEHWIARRRGLNWINTAFFKLNAVVSAIFLVVTLAEVRENDHNLNLTRYVQTEAPPDAIDVKAEVAKLTELVAKRDAAEATMMGFLKELGYAG